jgi:hypothetical protein
MTHLRLALLVFGALPYHSRVGVPVTIHGMAAATSSTPTNMARRGGAARDRRGRGAPRFCPTLPDCPAAVRVAAKRE